MVLGLNTQLVTVLVCSAGGLALVELSLQMGVMKELGCFVGDT